MQAQVLRSFCMPYVLQEVPVPELTSDYDILIHVDAASYCHTDAVLAAGLMATPCFPHIGCHEFAGTIVQIASDPIARRYDLQIGSRIGVPGRAFHPCGECFECCNDSDQLDDGKGYSVYCPVAKNLGLTTNGGFSQYAVVDARQVVSIPPQMTAIDAAPLMCAGLTIYTALRRCTLKAGQRVGIVGCGGGLGHLGLQFADKMGFKVLGVDTAAPLELARSLGTSATLVDATIEDAADIVHQIGKEDKIKHAGNMGLDAVIILPESQKAFDYGVSLLKNHGKCVVVSFPKSPIQFNSQDLVFRQISVVGSLVGSNVMLHEMMRFAANNSIRAITRRYSLRSLNKLVEDYHKGTGGKLVVDSSLKT